MRCLLYLTHSASALPLAARARICRCCCCDDVILFEIGDAFLLAVEDLRTLFQPITEQFPIKYLAAVVFYSEYRAQLTISDIITVFSFTMNNK